MFQTNNSARNLNPVRPGNVGEKTDKANGMPYGATLNQHLALSVIVLEHTGGQMQVHDVCIYILRLAIRHILAIALQKSKQTSRSKNRNFKLD